VGEVLGHVLSHRYDNLHYVCFIIFIYVVDLLTLVRDVYVVDFLLTKLVDLCIELLVTTVTMAVYVAVCEIFSIKEWRDLENQVRSRSRSLKMAQFDRPYATFYWSAIVNIALSCAICELFDVE